MQNIDYVFAAALAVIALIAAILLWLAYRRERRHPDDQVQDALRALSGLPPPPTFLWQALEIAALLLVLVIIGASCRACAEVTNPNLAPTVTGALS